MVEPNDSNPVPDLCAECLAKRIAWWAKFKLPPLPEAQAHKEALERLRRMTPAEQLASLVSAGIYNPDGTLAERYRDDVSVT